MWSPKLINTDKTLYVAIAEAIQRDIEAGLLKPGEKMPPQRKTAEVIGVNLTTITRAYNLAKKEGLLVGITGKGTFVSDNHREKTPMRNETTDDFIDLGLVGSLKMGKKSIKPSLEKLLEDDMLNLYLDYVPSEGLDRHRQAGQVWLSKNGYKTTSDKLVICYGVMQGINTSLQGLFKPGDKIAVESCTFTGVLNACDMHQISYEATEMDHEGMLPSALRRLCEKQTIKGLYLMPNMQNPTAGVMSKSRRKELAAIVQDFNLILIEDDVYNMLNGLPAISSMVPDHGIYLCGTSKTMFPGLRTAFAVVPDQLRRKFVDTLAVTTWMASPFCAEIVSDLILSGQAYEMIQEKTKILKTRCQLVRRYLKDYDLQFDQLGQFVWLSLPKAVDAVDLENRALLENVRIISANKFYAGNHQAPNAVRISYANVGNEKLLVRGLKIIRALIEDYKRPTIM